MTDKARSSPWAKTFPLEMVSAAGMAELCPMPRAPAETVVVPVKLLAELVSTQAVPPSTPTDSTPAPLFESWLVIKFVKALEPRRESVLLPVSVVSWATFDNTNDPVPSA